jgi:SAM-dependent methyltransferase
VTAIDITALAVQKLSANRRAEFHVADITDPAFPIRGPFDIVNMWDVIYHIINRNAFERALVNVKNCLRPGGLFLLTDHFGLPDDRVIAAHVQARSLATYQRVLQAAGFERLSVRPLYRFLNRLVISVRVDNCIVAIYFAIDNQIRKIASDNVSLALWRLSG